MKGIPVIRSKLVMPQLPSAVTVSKRLRRLGGKLRERSPVIITAPAGYGKTSLIVTALSELKPNEGRICWYRLDEEDRDPAFFYTHLVETLFPEGEKLWEEPRGYLSNCTDIAAQSQYLNALFCQELWAFHDLRPDLKTFLVFDDFQQIRDVSEITGAIQFFIGNLPENCAVIVSSRCETGLLTGKRRLERDVLEITSGELCFSEEEICNLVKNRTGITPDQSLLQRIMLHTEGWPAGIILACQMLNSSSCETGGILERSGQKELLFQYFFTEVLKASEESLLRFLTKAAILPELTIDEAVTIFEEKNALELLEKCMDTGLFIQKIFGTATTYRFHSLFREALRQIHPQHLSAAEVKNYHLKAAAYYIEHRNFDRAIEHFIACGNVDLAVDLVSRESVRLIAFEAVEQLRLWFKLLPEEAVSGNGYLLYIKSFIYHQKGTVDALRLLQQALALFQQADDAGMQVYTLIAMAHLYIQRNDMPGIRKIQAQAARLSAAAKGQPLEDMLAVFNFTLLIWEENLAVGAAMFRRVRSLDVADDWQWMLFYYSSIMYILLGKLDQAGEQIQKALASDVLKKSGLLRGYTQIFYATVLQLKDEPEALPPVLDELIAAGEENDYKLMLGFGKRMAACARYRHHDLESALELLEASTDSFEELGNTAMVSFNKLSRCLWLCGRDNPGELLDEAKKAIGDLTAVPSGLCLQEIGLSMFGAIAREAGNYELAKKSLKNAIQKSRSRDARQVLSGACLHLAKLYFYMGEPARGKNYLKRAFDLAAEKKYVMFWDMHFPTLVEMSARCVTGRIHADYARALIDRYYGPAAAEFFNNTAANTPFDLLQDFTDSFISQYGAKDGSNDPRISANLLGRFSIALNGAAIPDQEWKTKKIAGLLKFLLTRRGRPVSKDRLMEVFWPGADKKSALMSLRAATYELKKVLRKYSPCLAAEGIAQFLKEKRDTLEVRTGSLLEVDVDLFLSLAGELSSLLPDEDSGAQKKSILKRMVDLYRGDFLEDEVYEDWTFAAREELRSVYFKSTIQLANIHIVNQENSQAEKLLLKVLSADRYNEEACLGLIKLYSATGQRGRAARLYSNFTSRFEKDLQIKPDQRLAMVIKG